MKHLSTTVAAYGDLAAAEKDWSAVESAAKDGTIDLADDALVTRAQDGTITCVERHSHHGWGKGAVAGAMVGVLFPPSIVGAAIVGGGTGAVLSRLNRSLDRGDIKDLGEVMDSGEVALVVLAREDATDALNKLLAGATKATTRASSTAEEVQRALSADTKTGS